MRAWPFHGAPFRYECGLSPKGVLAFAISGPLSEDVAVGGACVAVGQVRAGLHAIRYPSTAKRLDEFVALCLSCLHVFVAPLQRDLHQNQPNSLSVLDGAARNDRDAGAQVGAPSRVFISCSQPVVGYDCLALVDEVVARL